MKILQIITLCELGGAQSVVINLANELCRNHEVIVAAGEGDGKMFGMLDRRVKIEHLKHLKRSLSPKNDFLELIELRKLYRKYRPDIIHLHSSKAGILGRIALPSKKIVYTVHGFDSIRVAYRKFLPVERFLQKSCKAIVGVSDYDKSWMERERITHNVSTIYNGIRMPRLQQEEKWNLPKATGRKRILCIARISPPKRLDIFIDTAKLLTDYDFIWIGNRTEMPEHPQNVYFMGNIPNAAIYNNDADLFMLPSDYEGLPIVIIEAMSCKLPVVASNVGGISEIVVNGQNGYTVENYATQFAQRINEILIDHEKYNAFSENSFRIFQEKLTVDKMVNSYLNIYDK